MLGPWGQDRSGEAQNLALFGPVERQVLPLSQPARGEPRRLFAFQDNRYDGQKQRLRLSIEETGLMSLVSEPWMPTVTEDRLPTALRLAADCGIIREVGDGTYAAQVSS